MTKRHKYHIDAHWATSRAFQDGVRIAQRPNKKFKPFDDPTARGYAYAMFVSLPSERMDMWNALQTDPDNLFSVYPYIDELMVTHAGANGINPCSNVGYHKLREDGYSYLPVEIKVRMPTEALPIVEKYTEHMIKGTT